MGTIFCSRKEDNKGMLWNVMSLVKILGKFCEKSVVIVCKNNSSFYLKRCSVYFVWMKCFCARVECSTLKIQIHVDELSDRRMFNSKCALWEIYSYKEKILMYVLSSKIVC